MNVKYVLYTVSLILLCLFLYSCSFYKEVDTSKSTQEYEKKIEDLEHEKLELENENNKLREEISFVNNENKGTMNMIPQYIEEDNDSNNKVILTVGPIEQTEEENKLVVNALSYEIQTKDEISEGDYPRKIGKDYLKSIYFVLTRQSGEWTITEIINE